jgi:hypothetical protein
MPQVDEAARDPVEKYVGIVFAWIDHPLTLPAISVVIPHNW